MSEVVNEVIVPNPHDELYNTIDTLDLEELKSIVEYCLDQKRIIHISDKRKKILSNQLRIERIKFRKELNDMKKQLENTRMQLDESSEKPKINKMQKYKK